MQGLRTVIYHVDDLEKAKAWYTAILGKKPYFDEPFYVGFNVGTRRSRTWAVVSC